MSILDNKTDYIDLPELAKVKQAIKESNLAQRQDSVNMQLIDLHSVAVALKMYDAADAIQKSLEIWIERRAKEMSEKGNKG